jgi:dihydrofolate reductase
MHGERRPRVLRAGSSSSAGDTFRLGEETGSLLLGRHTWERFARTWPVAGSISVSRGLIPRGLVDELRLLAFPTVAGPTVLLTCARV